ncbi:hypothetical protein HDV00_000622 [Rhizophlyctis rosea]|nr:hypothetical protein HDV00_000622 [Rhizophlyctis rosea]
MGICTSTTRSPPPSSAPSRPRGDSHKFDAEGRRKNAQFIPVSIDDVKTERVYVLPNDDEEMDRLHVQHYMVRLMFGDTYFSAPVRGMLEEGGKKVLDLGCGSGIWCFEIATEFPQCHVTGLDISPVQPGTVKPRNVTFMESDLTNLPLPFEDASFDYIHMRFLIFGLRTEFWPVLIAELTRIVKPGGYIELMELANPTMPGPTKVLNLCAIMSQATSSRGCDLTIQQKLFPYLSSQPSLTAVEQLTKTLYTHPNPSDARAYRVAKMWGDDMGQLFMGVKAALVAKGVCSEEEFGPLVRAHIAETLNTDHSFEWTRCWGRRKVVGEE